MRNISSPWFYLRPWSFKLLWGVRSSYVTGSNWSEVAFQPTSVAISSLPCAVISLFILQLVYNVTLGVILYQSCLTFSAASVDLAFSRAFWSVSVPLSSSNFLGRLCDLHLSINWSRICSSLASPNSQFSDSWNNLSTNWSAVSDSSYFAWRNRCLSKGMLTWCGKCSSSDLMAFAYSESCSGTGPGSVRTSKISCPTQWRSSAFFCESFLTPLASRKNSKERFQRRHLGPMLVGLPLQSSGLMFPNSMFTAIFGTFPLGDYWRLVFVLVASCITLLFLTFPFSHTRSNNNNTYPRICYGKPQAAEQTLQSKFSKGISVFINFCKKLRTLDF